MNTINCITGQPHQTRFCNSFWTFAKTHLVALQYIAKLVLDALGPWSVAMSWNIGVGQLMRQLHGFEYVVPSQSFVWIFPLFFARSSEIQNSKIQSKNVWKWCLLKNPINSSVIALQVNPIRRDFATVFGHLRKRTWWHCSTLQSWSWTHWVLDRLLCHETLALDSSWDNCMASNMSSWVNHWSPARLDGGKASWNVVAGRHREAE